MRPLIFLGLAAVLWGVNFHLAKVMVQSSSAIEAGFWRYLFGVSTLSLFTLGDFPRWTIIKENIKPLILIGIIGLFAFNYFFFLGLSSTTAVNAALIISLNPALTLILSHFILKSAIALNHLIGISLAFFGVLYLIFNGNFLSIKNITISKGDGWIFMANIVFALHHVWVKKYAGRLTSRHLTFSTNFICLMPFVVVLPIYNTGNFTLYPREFWFASIGIGVFGTALSYCLWNIGVAKKGSSQAGIFMNLVPLSTGVSAFVFGEKVSFIHLISGILIISGILFMQKNNRWQF
ncbi:DMT family transporter [Fulvivirgaceae bacterium BMA12]|uniref:DMT family transporter n=1 Tax=Agaribacillus aureus TaxID=3051825 RepID=A0ABT8L8C3_9BACT|nr:DMT family transporter [Fulvivirgaceae bacterium BMA12]